MPQRIIHGRGVAEHGSDIRIEQDDVGALPVAFVILARTPPVKSYSASGLLIVRAKKSTHLQPGGRPKPISYPVILQGFA
jgi:hypothetical protein